MCAGLSLFIIYGPYLSVVVCVLYAYNLTLSLLTNIISAIKQSTVTTSRTFVKRKRDTQNLTRKKRKQSDRENPLEICDTPLPGK